MVDYLNLESNFSLRQQLLRCHEQSGDERWAILSSRDRELLLSATSREHGMEKDARTIERMRSMIRESGIAGTNYQALTNDDGHLTRVTIKCLHTNYAHFCSTADPNNDQSNGEENPIGRMTHTLLINNFPTLQL
jgi:hypothetical protein